VKTLTRYRRSVAYSLAAVALALGVGLVVPSDADGASRGGSRPHRACVYEDSSWCVWQASGVGAAGNGVGDSFWAGHGPEGRSAVHYISHRQARCLLTHPHRRCGT
jgi:hypothetical protein